MQDVEAGIRKQGVLERNIKRLPMYEKLKTIKIDVSMLTSEEVMEIISRL